MDAEDSCLPSHKTIESHPKTPFPLDAKALLPTSVLFFPLSQAAAPFFRVLLLRLGVFVPALFIMWHKRKCEAVFFQFIKGCGVVSCVSYIVAPPPPPPTKRFAQQGGLRVREIDEKTCALWRVVFSCRCSASQQRGGPPVWSWSAGVHQRLPVSAAQGTLVERLDAVPVVHVRALALHRRARGSREAALGAALAEGELAHRARVLAEVPLPPRHRVPLGHTALQQTSPWHARHSALLVLSVCV